MTAAIVLVCTVLTTATGQAAAETDTARAEVMPLREARIRLAVADEVRDGYDRAEFRHWIDADRDDCSTRAEVLLREATTDPVPLEKASSLVEQGCHSVGAMLG